MQTIFRKLGYCFVPSAGLAARRALVVLLAILAVAGPRVGFADSGAPSVAFYYGSDVPVDMLRQFDWAVIEAAHVDAGQRQELQRYGTSAFAYVSLGESTASRGDRNVPAAALQGNNPDWNSRVADLTHPAWTDYIINKRIRPLWQAGYRGVFLDNLDSYRLFAKNQKDVAQQQKALVGLIERIRRTFPGIKLLLNRGFEILDRVHDDIAGVAAESLYKTWGADGGGYGDVPEKDTEYLLEQLQRVRQTYHLPAIAIDYVPPGKRGVARATARRIANTGLVPWVTNHAVDQIGVGAIEPIPRKVLVLYDKTDTPENEFAFGDAFLYAAMPLEYLGYAAVYRDVNAPLPADTLTGRYAGIVTWFDAPLARPARYQRWLSSQMSDGMRVAILGSPGFRVSGWLARRMGVQALTQVQQGASKITSRDKLVGFEGMPERSPTGQTGYTLSGKTAAAHLTLKDRAGTPYSTVITGDWGGIALSPWVLQQGLGDRLRWILDPFKFFEKALALPTMPVPDMTTENGSRYWLTEIDGDAFVSRANFPDSPFTGQVMLDEILRRYKVPTTVSIIEGEIGPTGLYPQMTDTLEPIARRIFALPWVEIGTHTYSHPFAWEKLQKGDLAGHGRTADGFAFNLPIDNYRYSLQKEVAGSTRYINDNLAPPGKKVKAVLWSGDAIPPEKALAIADRIGIANINGGNTAVTRDNPSLTQVSPMLRPLGEYLQVYAPVINENIYTNDMTGPLWGFRRVIETYKITNEPRRLKPIDIYFHFYSAASPAALNALQDVFDYAQTQQTLPLFASTYSDIARNWYHVGIARTLDGAWRITGARHARTLRLPKDMGWPDIAHSDGVAGVRDLAQGRYIALAGEPRVTMRLRDTRPAHGYLQRSNGRITEWHGDGANRRLQLKSETVPLRVTLAGVAGCRVHAPKAEKRTGGDTVTLRYRGTESGPIKVACGR